MMLRIVNALGLSAVLTQQSCKCSQVLGQNFSPMVFPRVTQLQTEHTTACYKVSHNSSPLVLRVCHMMPLTSNVASKSAVF